jgi:hypothetical protein
MSVEVKPEQLAAALARYDFAYLITVSADAQSHVVAVSPTLEADTLTVTGLGRRTRSNAEANTAVTLVWPPVDVGDYSLIVDGAARLNEQGLTLVPSRAVLHRSAPRLDAKAGSCESDCVDL